MNNTSSLATQLWRWLFPTVILGTALPLLIYLAIEAVRKGSTPEQVLGRGELFMLAVTVLAGSYPLLNGDVAKPEAAEALRDTVVFLIALGAGVWSAVSAFVANGVEIDYWVPLWLGMVDLALAIVVGLGCFGVRQGVWLWKT